MKTNIKIITLLMLLLMLSCKRFVEIDVPTNKLVSESVFQNDATATSALFNIYVGMTFQTVNPYLMALYPGLSADELTPFSTVIGLQQLYKNAIPPLEGFSLDLWNAGYNYLFQVNAVIEGCLASTSLRPEVRKQLVAESKFIRAFWHFYLVNYFGPIPVVTTTDYTMNSSLARSSVAQVYAQILIDLNDAKNDLNENYVNVNSVTTSTERVRPNKAAASALLARVYLYTGNYVDAERESSTIIAKSSTYALVPLDQAFLKNSQEAIWQLMPPTPATINTPEGAGFILTNKPSPNSTTISNALTASLLSDFDVSDQRKVKWIAKYTDKTVTPNVDYYYPFKYKVQSGSTLTEYSVILRLAEQFLIRAEARALQGNLPGAISDLDEVRKRAGLLPLKDTNPGIGKEDLLNEIFNERRRELFTEWGHRWLDLKRTGRIDKVMSQESSVKSSVWRTTAQYYPIPESETLKNKKLTQNEGY